MITLKIKDIKELKKKIGKNNLMITCSMCPYWNYSIEEIDEVADKLDAGTFNVEKICDRKKLQIDTVDYDTVLVFSCGTGVQIISEALDINPIPVADTLSIGAKFSGKLQSYCKGCGDCILDYTQGLCPITRCPKGMLNGPCGGMQKGMCEKGDQPCVWALIYKRMERKKQLKEYLKLNMPKVSKT